MILRPATWDDRDFLRALRNDPAVCAASGSTGEVAPETHAKWLTDVLADEVRELFVAEQDGERIGTGRLDWSGDGYEWAEVSIALVPEVRGKGYGRVLLGLLIQRAGTAPLHARVRPANGASLALFESAGFTRDPFVWFTR